VHYYTVFFYTLGAFAIGAIVMAITPLLSKNKAKRPPWFKFIVYFLIVHGIILSIIAPKYVFEAIAAIIAIMGAVEVLKASMGKNMGLAFTASCFVVYLVLAYGFVRFSFSPTSQVLFVYLLVITFDGFSQVSGHLLGKHKLAAKISPNKSVEGLIGGLVCTAIAAILIDRLLPVDMLQAIIVSSFICVTSLAGDLAASWYKRKTGIKDFSKILPEHGGILDRFDSFIVAGCFWYLAGWIAA